MNASMSAPWKMQQQPGHRPSLHLTSTAGLPRGHGRSTLSFAPRRVSSMARPRLVPVSMTTRIMYHPATFLLHLGGITLGTMLVPGIATRRQLASKAANDTDTAASSTTAATAGPPKSLVDDRIHPSPTPRQLINLANSLRRQFHAPSGSPTPSKLQSPADPDSVVPLPYDACFTLRQLHMTMQRPHITLPPTHIYGYSMPLPTLKPEKWVWRLPATCALHAMLRHLLHRRRNNEKSREMLEPLIVQLVQHALYWDGLIWTAVVKSRGSEAEIEWWWLFEKLRGNITGEGANEDVGILSTISSGQVIKTTTPHSLQRSTEMPLAAPSDAATRSRKRRSPAHRRRVERRRVEMSMNPQNMRQSQLDQADLHSVEVLGQFCEPASAAAADLTSHPLSSIPLPTLELVFDCLARSPSSSTRSSALSIALSMSNLSFRRSARFHSQAFDLALALGRPDHAARFWSDWLVQSPYHSSGSTRRRLANELTRLKPHLRASREEFSSELGQKQLSAMATLTRALHLEWSRRSAASDPERPLVESLLLDLVGSFPPSIEQIAVEGQSEYRRVHRLHSAVFLMARQVMLEVLSSLLGRQVIAGASVTDPAELGPPLLPSGSESSPPHRLDIFTFNVLITYALRQLQSYPIASELVSKLRQLGLTPTATTHNLLFETLLHSDLDPLEAIKSGQIPHNDHTWSLLLSHLARTKQAHRIDEVVFYLLPELDHSSVVGKSKPATEPTPPREDKGAEFYTVLLSALFKLRKTGLAERVFRHARWAAQRSRQTRPVVETQVEAEPIVRSVRRRGKTTIESTPATAPSPDRVKPWVLPPAAYISMLLLYANEAQHPHHSLEPGQPPHARTFVNGWGRRPLRIHTQKARQQELEAKFGSSFASSRPRQTRSINVSGYSRKEAAAIVAMYELEVSSSVEEMGSLAKAMKSDLGRRCLKILFPEMQGSEQGVRGAIRRRRRDLKEEMEVLRAR
ncbi:BZ3500_MvSof-1268-A1-R1_Chr7-3g09664 [Microbotryum saponariae]|uniref:BZ3500_MvSof-1268-A1-R1_Chr7-3g09664 protein n=1 Tax=Microbotryum saponariae TaxID=289078 RepID=A0A2X0KY08_9BASI|nr:BZ3501_MvSof-1269-A2-R1_Chr7-2g09387 [Microbotryum saponariae]SDA02372.1 BZ3500_MvSof-1268-A1-R1_Chr7-3g09664 [Microbotryum saponariae]